LILHRLTPKLASQERASWTPGWTPLFATCFERFRKDSEITERGGLLNSFFSFRALSGNQTDRDQPLNLLISLIGIYPYIRQSFLVLGGLPGGRCLSRLPQVVQQMVGRVDLNHRPSDLLVPNPIQGFGELG